MAIPVRARGVLNPELAATKIALTLREPSAAVAPFVEYYWIVRWDLRDQAPHEQKILPHPTVHLAFEEPVSTITGVVTGLYRRWVEGGGQVLGVRFRPGCFRPVLGEAVSSLTGKVLKAAELFGASFEAVERDILRAADDDVMVGLADEFLTGVLPDPDPLAGEIAGMVTRIATDHSLLRVDQVAETFGISVRRLQRLFGEYVGVSPKWVLRRSRLHDAAERAGRGTVVDWATLAADLGYADQAHLTRDFTATIGVSPARYAAGATG